MIWQHEADLAYASELMAGNWWRLCGALGRLVRQPDRFGLSSAPPLTVDNFLVKPALASLAENIRQKGDLRQQKKRPAREYLAAENRLNTLKRFALNRLTTLESQRLSCRENMKYHQLAAAFSSMEGQTTRNGQARGK